MYRLQADRDAYDVIAERNADPRWSATDYSIEVDPRVTSVRQLEILRACGFNRISMGVQDFNPEVQKAINRVQSFEMTRDLVHAARDLGFQSVNLDLIYGLPYQTVAGFTRTIEQVLEIRPDRIACYSYAHVPWLKKHQRIISEETLPEPSVKLDLYRIALDALQEAGFVVIGMDHFAQQDDELAVAAGTGSLHRNFQGYSTHPAEEMLSFGVTAIGEVDRAGCLGHTGSAGSADAHDRHDRRFRARRWASRAGFHSRC